MQSLKLACRIVWWCDFFGTWIYRDLEHLFHSDINWLRNYNFLNIYTFNKCLKLKLNLYSFWIFKSFIINNLTYIWNFHLKFTTCDLRNLRWKQYSSFCKPNTNSKLLCSFKPWQSLYSCNFYSLLNYSFSFWPKSNMLYANDNPHLSLLKHDPVLKSLP